MVVIVALAGVIFPARAVVSPDRSRIILQAKNGEESLLLMNTATVPSLVQVWVDDGNPLVTPDKLSLPIAVVPPVFKLDGDQQRDVRIKLLKSNLVENVEKLYWINIYQVPPNTTRKSVTMQQVIMPLRIRLKLILRPAGMESLKESEGELVNFTLSKDKSPALLISNPGKRVLSLSGIRFNATNHSGLTLLPGDNQKIPLSNEEFKVGKQAISWSIVNDMGVNSIYKREI